MKTKIFVQVWTELDPSLNIKLNSNSHPEAIPGDQLWRLSPLGRHGLELAKKIDNAEVFCFAVGSQHDAALIHALAAGAHKAFRVQSDPALDSKAIVAEISQWLKKSRADLIIGDRLAGAIAQHSGFSHLAGLEDLEIKDASLVAKRVLSSSHKQKVSGSLPAAVRLNEHKLQIPYINHDRISQISLNSIENVTLKSPAVQSTATWGPYKFSRARTKIGKKLDSSKKLSGLGRFQALLGSSIKKPPTPSQEPKAADTKTPQSMAEEFVRYLVHNDLVNLTSKE